MWASGSLGRSRVGASSLSGPAERRSVRTWVAVDVAVSGTTLQSVTTICESRARATGFDVRAGGRTHRNCRVKLDSSVATVPTYLEDESGPVHARCNLRLDGPLRASRPVTVNFAKSQVGFARPVVSCGVAVTRYAAGRDDGRRGSFVSPVVVRGQGAGLGLVVMRQIAGGGGER